MYTAIVADKRRERMGAQLYCLVDADFMAMDAGILGCTGNHLQAWQWHAEHPDEWSLTLEDDAVPVDDFPEQAAAALAVAPAPIVSFYLGKGSGGDAQRAADVRNAQVVDANWLVGTGPHHAVALAIRSELVAPMIEGVQKSKLPIDQAMGQWARRAGHRVAYCHPSLVDHRDAPSLVSRYRRAPRVAWQVGSRKQWNDTAIPLV